jgi:hypothetical protein
VKRSGRDEPKQVSIHKCMEAMLGISLYSYLYLKVAKTLCLSHCFLCFLFNKIREEEGGTGSAWKGRRWEEGGGGRREEVAKTIYICINKCKNDKTKERKNCLCDLQKILRI